MDKASILISSQERNDNKILEEMKREKESGVERQKTAYEELLRFIKQRQSKNQTTMTKETEHLFLRMLKIISDGHWVIENENDFGKVLETIKAENEFSDQTYFFFWYAADLLGLDGREAVDNYFASKDVNLNDCKVRRIILSGH